MNDASLDTAVFCLILAVAVLVFLVAAFAKTQPARPALVPLGLAIATLAFFLQAAGWS